MENKASEVIGKERVEAMQVELIGYKNRLLELEDIDRQGPNMDEIHEEVKHDINLKLWADEQEQQAKAQAVSDKEMGKWKIKHHKERKII